MPVILEPFLALARGNHDERIAAYAALHDLIVIPVVQNSLGEIKLKAYHFPHPRTPKVAFYLHKEGKSTAVFLDIAKQELQVDWGKATALTSVQQVINLLQTIIGQLNSASNEPAQGS